MIERGIILNKYDTNWFKNRIKEKRPYDFNAYVVIGSYVNAHTKIKMFHKTCGRYFSITPNSFLNGRGCHYCGNQSSSEKQKLSLQEVYNRIPDSYIILEQPKSLNERTLFYCEDCGHVFSAMIHDIEKHKAICHYCRFSNRNKDNDEFKWQVSLLVGTEYTFLDSYVNAHTPLLVKHNKCGMTYKVTPHNFLRGKRCPRCRESHGESYISNLLSKHHIKYIRQKSFDNCKYKHKLLFDFYLPDYNLCIEYDGEQHFHHINYLGVKNKFLLGKKRDKIKDDFCRENNIKLLRIPYTVSFDNIYKLIKNSI